MELLKRMVRRRGFHVAMLMGLIAIAARMVPMSAFAGVAVDPADRVMRFLDRTVDWSQRVRLLNQAAVNSEEVVYRDTIRQHSGQILQLGFSFAKAQAQLLGNPAGPTTGPTGSSISRVNQAAATAAERVTKIQGELDQAIADIQKAPAPVPDLLTARRDKLVAQLNLAKARQEVLQNLVGFNAGNGAAGSLAQKIDDLEHSLPDPHPAASDNTSSKPAVVVQANPQTAPPRPETAGILTLVTELFSLSSRMGELKEIANETAALKAENDEFRPDQGRLHGCHPSRRCPFARQRDG